MNTQRSIGFVSAAMAAAMIGLAGGCANKPAPSDAPAPASANKAPAAKAQAPAKAEAAPKAPAAEAGLAERDRLVAMMVGSFSSQAQAAADPEFRDIRLHMARIWADRQDGAWLYVEQAVSTALDKPYRQRVYRVVVKDAGAGTFRSDVYTLPGDALAYAGAWNNPSKLAGLTPEQLTLRDGCSMHLKAQADGTFVGGTDGTGCASDLRGAAFAVSEATITPQGLLTWDRGFNQAGDQVWGATKGGYEFKRVAP
jgi:hypothetical protein